MSKMRRNLLKIKSCAIFSWFRFSSYFNAPINVKPAGGGGGGGGGA